MFFFFVNYELVFCRCVRIFIAGPREFTIVYTLLTIPRSTDVLVNEKFLSFFFFCTRLYNTRFNIIFKYTNHLLPTGVSESGLARNVHVFRIRTPYILLILSLLFMILSGRQALGINVSNRLYMFFLFYFLFVEYDIIGTN